MPKAGPLIQAHRAAGVAIAEAAGWLTVDHFGDPRAEYEAVRTAVGLLDLSHHGKVRITGADAQDFLNRMLTNDVKGLAAGRGCTAFLLNPKGHVVAYLVLHALAEGFLAEADPAMATSMRAMLERYVIADDVTLEDVGDAWGLLSLQGPQAPAVLGDLLGAGAPALEPLHHKEGEVGGVPVRTVSHSRAGEPGFDLWVPADRAAAVWEAVSGAGRPRGLRPVGLQALEVLRLEAGQAWASDVGGDMLALETGLEGAINFTKGCYIGQEFVVRVAHRGHVNRRLSGLVLSGEGVPARGAKVLSGGKEMGWVTSAAFSPALGRPIALGYVRRERNDPGSKVSVQVDGDAVEAEVVALPFVRRPSA